RRYAPDRVRIVAGDDEVPAGIGQGRGWPATLLLPEYLVLRAIPGHHRMPAVVDVEKLVLVPDRSFGEPGILVDDLHLTGFSGSRNIKQHQNRQRSRDNHYLY